MYQIHLGPLHFFAYHGIHEEEIILGNQFEVTLDISAIRPEKFDQLSDAVDYSLISEVVRYRMHQPTPLLETIADQICNDLFQQDQRIREIQISIYKLYPPITGNQGKVGISLTKTNPA